MPQTTDIAMNSSQPLRVMLPPARGVDDMSAFLRSLPEPARASADHRLALACDALEPGKFLSWRGEGFKPALDFQALTEKRTICIFNVVVTDREPGKCRGDLAPRHCFPARVVQHLHRGRIIHLLHEIDL